MQGKVTPVYIAAAKGHVGALRALISAGADFNAANVVSIIFHFVCTILYLEFKSEAID